MPDALMVLPRSPRAGKNSYVVSSGGGPREPEERERRLATARIELEAENEFDVTIVNTNVESACQELVDLF